MTVFDTQRDRSTTADGESLPPAALRFKNLQTVVAAVPVATLLTAATVFVKIDWVVFVALWVLLPLCVVSVIVDLAVVNRLQHRAYHYSHDRSTVEIRHGIFVRSTTTISTVQILSVDIVQGPLLRSCGLASVVFRTIGGTVRLGPVTPASADAIRVQVMRALEVASR